MYYDVMGYKEYEDYVEELTNKSKSKKSYGNRVLVPARRFLLGQTISPENPIAIPLAGYTIITPPKKEDEDKDNKSAYQSFKIVQDSLNIIAGVAFAPEPGWHMTIADLVCGYGYVEILLKGQDNNLIEAIQNLFVKLRTNHVLFPRIEMHVRGLGLFPDCIVAVLMPATEDGYRSLREFRHFVYSESSELKKLGVKGVSRYGFHITLGYVEDYLKEDARNRLTNTLKNINETLFTPPIPFIVNKAQLARFENMSGFVTTKEGVQLPFFEFC